MYSLHHFSQPSIVLEMTDREREVLKFVFKGLKNIDIAKQLFVSENTIKNTFKTYIEGFK